MRAPLVPDPRQFCAKYGRIASASDAPAGSLEWRVAVARNTVALQASAVAKAVVGRNNGWRV